jgi:hypothetical protein
MGIGNIINKNRIHITDNPQAKRGFYDVCTTLGT